MTAWTRIREIFEAVVDLDPATRTARLDALCGDDPALRSDVTRLLSQDANEDSAAIDATPALDLIALDPTRVRRVGSYEIVRVIGAGGMGTVFEARQERPRRTVALKVLRTLVASDAARRRLEYEAETLARLQHPNIAQVYESGTWRDPDTGEESPFFAMEFVGDARPLDEFADVHELDLRARIELFLAVCDAVHHGHQVGVLHRDLKPANLLVGADGRPKIIDFGLARAIEGVNDGATPQTMTGMVLGTLGYMSPEQLDADVGRIDARADVYSLGATLYELLVGHTPHGTGATSLTEFTERVRNERARRPSACEDTPVPIPGELDWVVLQALQPEPDERYASVSEFAADLRRFLADEPLAARPPTTGYLLRKFVRRHRGLVFGGAAVFVLAVAGGIVSALGWMRAAESDAEARLEAHTQSAITRYMMELVRKARADRDGRDARIVDMLDDSEQLIGELSDGRPEVALSIREAVTESYVTLGLDAEAATTAAHALATVDGVLSPDDLRVLRLRGIQSMALRRLQRVDEARSIAEDVIARRARQVGYRDNLVADMQVELGTLDHDAGAFESAAEHKRRAAETYAWFAENAELPSLRRRARRSLANVEAHLCGILIRQGKHDEAQRLGAETLESMADLFQPDEASVVSLRESLANSASMTGRFDEAIALMREVVAARERVFGSGPTVLGARSSLAGVLARAGRLDEAISEFESVCAAHDARGDSDVTAATARFNLAATLEKSDRLEEAERRFVALFDQLDPKVLPATHWLRAQFRKSYGRCLRRLGRLDEAETELLAALAVLEKSFSADHRRVQLTLQELVELYRQTGDDVARARYEARLSSSR